MRTGVERSVVRGHGGLGDRWHRLGGGWGGTVMGRDQPSFWLSSK